MQSDLNSEKLAEYIIEILKNTREMKVATQRLAQLDATFLVASYCSAEAE